MVMSETLGVKDKVAIVTGAGRKIGKRIAEVFVAQGMKVVIADINADAAKATSSELGKDTIDVACDISKESDVKELVNRTVNTFGRVDVLVNNAAFIVRKPLLDISSDEFSRVVDVILQGTFLCTKYVVERMVQQGEGGKIVNIAAGIAQRGYVNYIAYCAAKGAVLNMTRQLAVELAKHKINVNSISPGMIDAPVGFEYTTEPRSAEGIPLGRIGKSEDVANAALFLVSDLAEYITGVDLPVDGGMLARA